MLIAHARSPRFIRWCMDCGACIGRWWGSTRHKMEQAMRIGIWVEWSYSHHSVPSSSSVRIATGSGNVNLLRPRDDKLHIQLTNSWRPLRTLIFVGSRYVPSTSTTSYVLDTSPVRPLHHTFEIRPQYVHYIIRSRYVPSTSLLYVCAIRS